MKVTDSQTLLKLCYGALDDKKADDVRVLDVREQSSITDYLVLATANSETHLRALRVELEKVIDAADVHLVGIETAQESGWTVVDAFDVMIHLFTAEARDRYRLENLWKDAKDVSAAKLLKMKNAVKPKIAKRPSRKKSKA
jgi:ribosome-associated protein